MKKAIVLTLVLAASNCWADDASEGRTKADVACALCHGPNGIAMMPSAPNLAGQSAQYLSEQLKHYRSGQRQNPVMGVIAKPLTDGEIRQLSAWYSAIKVTAELP